MGQLKCFNHFNHTNNLNVFIILQGFGFFLRGEAENSKTRVTFIAFIAEKAHSCILPYESACVSASRKVLKKPAMQTKETLRCPFLCCSSRDTSLQRPKQASGDLRSAAVLNVLWQSLNVSMKSPHQLSLLWVEKPRKHPTNLLDNIELKCLTGVAGTWPSLWLFSLFFPPFLPPFSSCARLVSLVCHSLISLQGVAKELTAVCCTTFAFSVCFFPLFSALAWVREPNLFAYLL